MSYEAKFKFSQADNIITLLPVPAGDVEQVGLVVVLHQLDDHPDVITIIFDGDDSHDVCSIFSIRIRTIFICQN